MTVFESTPEQIAEMLSKVQLRPCGECTACCEVIGVAELQKPYYAKCQHCTTHCTIYATRPNSCVGFICLWKSPDSDKNQAFLTEASRPDKLGAVFDVSHEPPRRILEVYESRNLKKQDAKNIFSIAQRIIRKWRYDALRWTPYRTYVGMSGGRDPRYTDAPAEQTHILLTQRIRNGLPIEVQGATVPKHLDFL